MPPSAKKKPGKVASGTVATGGSELASALDKVTINDKSCPYSFDQKDPWLLKVYTKSNVNYAEVDFFAGAVFSEGSFIMDLVKNGHGMRYRKSTPSMFGEVARLKKDMGRRWHHDDTRVVAHDDTVQVIRAKDKPVHDMHWGREDCLVVPLPFRCRGKIKKSWHYYRSGISVKNNQQYIAVLTCRVEAAEQRSEKEKKGRIAIHDDDPEEEESDSDAEEERDEVGSGMNVN